MEYFRKLEKPDKKIKDIIEWSVPEQKMGRVALVAGNLKNFATAVHTAEAMNSLPFENTELVLPDSLRGSIPPVPGVDFVSSTSSGSFARSPELIRKVNGADFTLLAGDVSKNQETATAFVEAIKAGAEATGVEPGTAETGEVETGGAAASEPGKLPPLLFTRDVIDAVTPDAESFISRDHLFFLITAPQLKNLLQSLLYPRMFTLTQPILQVAETLHKFTLSYTNLTIITYYSENILVAHSGSVTAVPISNTNYSPMSLWLGSLAVKIMAMNCWAPGQPNEATLAAIFWDGRTR